MTAAVSRSSLEDCVLSATQPDNFDLAEQLANIRRVQIETDKFAAEQRRRSEEANKLALESGALRVFRWVTPIAAVIGASVAAVLSVMRVGGHG